jgi:transcriptional regulator with XRE-family HTH domain
MKTISERIKAARVAAGLSQRELADRLGVDPQVISRWERGTARPGRDRLAVLAEFLACRIEALL